MLEFKVEDKIFLNLSPWKNVIRFRRKHGVIRFRRKGKESPKFYMGLVGYKLRFASALSRIHNVFHVSMLQKYVLDSSHVLQE